MGILVGMKIPQLLKKELIKGLQGKAGGGKPGWGEKRVEGMTPSPSSGSGLDDRLYAGSRLLTENCEGLL